MSEAESVKKKHIKTIDQGNDFLSLGKIEIVKIPDEWNRNHGILEEWNIGMMEFWKNGTMEPWITEHLEYWNSGVLDLAKEYWSNGKLEKW